MTWVIEKDESTASRRVIEFRTFASNGTGPDTGSSNSSLRMSIGGNAQFTPNALVSAISAAAGMYYFILGQSDVSQLGNHSLWYEGAFPQHVATVQVVNYNPFSSLSNLGAKDYSSSVTMGVGIATPSKVTVQLQFLDYSSAVTVGVGKIAAATYSGVTVGAGDYAAKDMTSALTVGVGIATPSKVTVRLSALDYSSVVTVGAGIAAPSLVTVQVSANNDKTGYDITSLNGVAVSAILQKMGVMDSGTAAAIANGTITLRSGHGIPATTVMVYLTGGTNALGKSRLATYSGAGDVFNVDPAWNANGETTPSGTVTYVVLPVPPAPTTTNLPTVTVSTNNDKTGYSLAAADYSSSVTVGVGIATPSKVTVQVSANNDKTGYTIATGDYSSTVTFGTGTIKPATYSGVTVGASVSLAVGTYSGVTVGVNNIAPATYSGVTVGAAVSISGTVQANVVSINSSNVTGSGTTTSPWRPV